MTVTRRSWKNLVFTGGPGTGKSRAAAAVARTCRELGVLSSGHLAEVTAADLDGPTLRRDRPAGTRSRGPRPRRHPDDHRRAHLRQPARPGAAEQVTAHAQVAQHQVAAVAPGHDRADRLLAGGLGRDHAEQWAIGSVIPWVNSAVVRASSKVK